MGCGITSLWAAASPVGWALLHNCCNTFNRCRVPTLGIRPLPPLQGYILGGLMWFSIPFTLATSLGLASVALDLPITKEEAGAGLVPPAVAVYILGKSGAVWITIMLFMAVTSTGSAELIAVSSLFSYDLYR